MGSSSEGSQDSNQRYLAEKAGVFETQEAVTGVIPLILLCELFFNRPGLMTSYHLALEPQKVKSSWEAPTCFTPQFPSLLIPLALQVAQWKRTRLPLQETRV